jgi:hypothetical protein
MGPLSYMRPVVNRNVVMRRIPVHILFRHSVYTRALIIFRWIDCLRYKILIFSNNYRLMSFIIIIKIMLHIF